MTDVLLLSRGCEIDWWLTSISGWAGEVALTTSNIGSDLVEGQYLLPVESV